MITLRCPNCGKTIQMPASYCPHCNIELRNATVPKKKKAPLLGRLVTLAIILACAALIFVLVKRLFDGGAFRAFRKYQGRVESVEPLPSTRALLGGFAAPVPLEPPVPPRRTAARGIGADAPDLRA